MTDHAKAEDLPTLKAVRSYLTAHPTFFAENQDLLVDLEPPIRVLGDGVADIQKSMNDRLRTSLAQLRAWKAQFIKTSRDNLNLIERFHVAAFNIVDADSLPELTSIIEQILPDLLDLDAACLLVEAADVPVSWLDGGLRAVAPGKSAIWMGTDEILLRPKTQDRFEIHGPKATMILSDALIRLPLPEGYPRVMLAMGVGSANHFHPEQGTEFLAFLSAVIARCLMRWAQL